MPHEAVIQADPEVWTLVPASIDDAVAWLETQVAKVPAHLQPQTADAARLALGHRIDSEVSIGLFLSLPADHLLGMLGIVVLDDVPAPSTAADAGDIAASLLPSPWPAEVIAITLGSTRGWRATVLDPENASGDEAVSVPQTVSTVYVLDVGGRCAVAAMSPLAPLAAVSAQILAERALATLDVVEVRADA